MSERRSPLSVRPRWVDVDLIHELEMLQEHTYKAIIAVHRINALNAKDTLSGGPVEPWTDEQIDFIEREHLMPIAKAVVPIAKAISND